jgi:hypothetical protein
MLHRADDDTEDNRRGVAYLVVIESLSPRTYASVHYRHTNGRYRCQVPVEIGAMEIVAVTLSALPPLLLTRTQKVVFVVKLGVV